MAMREVSLFVLAAFCQLACGSEPVAWHTLEHRELPFRTFDHTVLGNLESAEKLANMRVPRSHAFLTTIDVGTPPQPLRCLLDTGFADLWLPSRRCNNCDAGHFFEPDVSSTFMPAVEQTPQKHVRPLRPVRIPYAGAAVNGFLAQDTVHFGTGIFQNQSFLLMGDVTLPRERDWDGICGLGRYQVATAGEPLYKKIAAASHAKQAIFSFVPGHDHKSYLVVGQVPEAACKADTIAWAQTESITRHGKRNFWVATGGIAIHANSPVRSRFMLDTGTAFLLAPPNKYGLFMRSLFPLDVFDHRCGIDAAADNMVICDCDIVKSSRLLPLRFYFGDKEFVMEVEDLFQKVPTRDGGEACLLQIQQNPLSSSDPLDLLGDLLDSKSNQQRFGPQAALVDTSKDVDVTIEPGALPYNMTRAPPWLVNAELQQMGFSHEVTGRRMQTPVHLPGAGELTSDRMEELVNDLWVIGGVFLKRFVTIVDFEEGRIGFAEPADKIIMPSRVKVAPSLATTRQPRAPLVPPVYAHPAPNLDGDLTTPTSAAAARRPVFHWGTASVGIVLLLGAAAPVYLLRKSRRRKNEVVDGLDEEEGSPERDTIVEERIEEELAE